MTGKHRFGLAVSTVFLLSYLLPSVAQAQRMAPAAAPRVSSVRARPGSGAHPVITRNSTSARSAQFSTASNGIFVGAGAGLAFQEPYNPSAGFGFDLGGYSPVDRELAIKAFIDPVTQLQIAFAERLLGATRRFVGPGYYLIDGGGAYTAPVDSAEPDQPPQQQQSPQVIVVQAPVPQPAAQSGPALEASAPLPDVGQFTLVLQSGKQIEAVAFARAGDRIVYITADGSRRTLAAADLNSAETVRINQERGTPLELPL